MADQDDEFLLDAPDAVPSETSAVQPAEGDTEMTVDEEGRPKFPAAKNTVWISISISKSSTVLKKRTGWTTTSRNQKSPYPSSPPVSFESSLAETVPATCRAPQAASPNEYQE
jgi:hypothetical protein